MQITVTEEMETLIRMIESQRQKLEEAKDRGESREVTDALVLALREIQSGLADLITETYRHEVRV